MTETSGPRGRISLIKAVDEGSLPVLSTGFVHQMSECLDCRACAAACPSGVEYGDLVEGARARIQTETKHPPLARLGRWLTLKVLFGNLLWLRFMAVLVRFCQRTGLQAFASRTGLLRRLGLSAAETLAPEIPASFFVARGQRADARSERRVAALHAGCIMSIAFPDVHRATMRVLQRNGCTVVVHKGQGCCGAIAVHAGEAAFGRRLAKQNIAAFERSGAEIYVVNAAGCGSALKEYGDWLRDDPAWAERARNFSERVRDVTELLGERPLAPGMGALPIEVTYQDACHLAHAQRITAAPRRLLEQIPGLKLREMRESALCCGSAGVYNVTQPAMSERLRNRKIAHVLETHAGTVATANPGCALQLHAGLREKNSDVRVAHVVELLDEAYRAGVARS